jgi:hypothetical protein
MGRLRLTHYETALLLTILSAAITFRLWLIVFRSSKDPTASMAFGVVALLIPLGLWLGSNFIRWLGVVYLVLIAGAVLWPFVSSEFQPTRLELAALFIFLATINLITAAILVFSKKFRIEFAKLRESLSRQKIYLRRALNWAIAGACIVATLNDLYHLFLV